MISKISQNIEILVSKYQKSTTILHFGSRLCKLGVNLQILVLFRPLFRSHTGGCLENAEERCVAGKTRLQSDG